MDKSNFDSVSLRKLISPKAKALKLKSYTERQKFYVNSYKALVSGVDELIRKKVPNAGLLIAHMVYGWMPTGLKSANIEFFDSNPGLLNEIRAVRSFKKAHEFVKKLDANCTRPLINNSWVGTSKFLHFVNPKWFPIWDSKVAAHFSLQEWQIGSSANYLKYIDWMSREVKDASTAPLHKLIEQEWGYNVSACRSAEFALFITPPKNSS